MTAADSLKLVERVLAETSLKKEMLIPVDGDHGSIGELKRGSPVAAAVENLIVNAQQRTEDSLVINIGILFPSLAPLLC